MKHFIHIGFLSFLSLFFLTGCELWITPIEENANGQTPIHIASEDRNASNGNNIIGIENVPEGVGASDFRVEIEGKGKENFTASVAKKGTTFYLSVLPKDGFIVKVTEVFDFNATVYILDKPSCSRPISITVQGSNHMPMAEAQSLSVDENMPLNITLVATDQDKEDILTFNIAKNPIHGRLVGTAPHLTYVPDTNYSGTDSFSYFVSDGYVNTQDVIVNIVINHLIQNHSPVIKGIPNTVINEDDAYQFLPNASDLDANDTLSFEIQNQPSWTNFDTSTGALTGTPSNANVGMYTGIVISVSDGTVKRALPPFNIEVINVNDAPVAMGDFVMMQEDTNISLTLQGTDIDTGATLTYHLVAAPSNGNVTIVGNNALYIPNPNYFGTDGFTFEAKDEYNATSNAANIDINISDVAEPNTPPVAKDINISMDGNTTSVVFDLNASDVDGDTLIYTVIDLPAYGNLTHASGGKIVVYNRGTYTGNTSFTYRVNDGTMDSNIATVYIQSNIPNTPPVAYNQSINLDANGTPVIVLDANDTDIADVLTYRITTQPSYGTLTLNGNQVTYMPNPNYTGNDSFTFVANDGTDDSNEALIYVNVGNVQLTSQVFAWCKMNDIELWSTDGTAAGTAIVKNIRTSGSAKPQSFVKIKNTYFFVADDGVHGRELWKTQGTAGSTVLVKDIKTKGNGHSDPHNLLDVNGTLFFAAKDGINGIELWKSDGTTLGTTMVKNINSKGHSKPKNLIDINGVLYFSADNGKKGRELWKSDGTANGTLQVNDINSRGSSNPQYLTNVNGILYFSADDGGTYGIGRELWYYDTTISDVASGYTNRGYFDIFNGIESSNPSHLFNYNGLLVFSADGGRYGYELWRIDGVRFSMYPNFAGDAPFKGLDANPHNFASIGAKLYFSAYNFSTGYNLRVLDSVNTTSIGNAIYTDMQGSNYFVPAPENLMDVNGTLFADSYIVSQDQNGTVTGESIYVWSTMGKVTHLDTVLTNTKALKTYDILHNALLFSTTKTDNNEELWKSNMGAAPTLLQNGCHLPY
jgi:ELWxxDGT repeat protein